MKRKQTNRDIAEICATIALTAFFTLGSAAIIAFVLLAVLGELKII